MLLLEVLELSRERVGVGEQTQRHVEAGQHARHLGAELGRQHLVALHAREELGRGGGFLMEDAASKARLFVLRLINRRLYAKLLYVSKVPHPNLSICAHIRGTVLSVY